MRSRAKEAAEKEEMKGRGDHTCCMCEEISGLEPNISRDERNVNKNGTRYIDSTAHVFGE